MEVGFWCGGTVCTNGAERLAALTNEESDADQEDKSQSGRSDGEEELVEDDDDGENEDEGDDATAAYAAGVNWEEQSAQTTSKTACYNSEEPPGTVAATSQASMNSAPIDNSAAAASSLEGVTEQCQSIDRAPPVPTFTATTAAPIMKQSVVMTAILLCVFRGGSANAAQGSTKITPPVSLDSSATIGIVAPAGWTKLTMLREDGKTPFNTVLIRDGADAFEVAEVIYAGCREAGVSDDHASSFVDQWLHVKLNEQQKGYERSGFMFERTGSKRTFERFLGEIATVAEERPFYMLEMGSWEGASAMWVAENLLKNPASLLVCLDTWDGGVELHRASLMSDIERRFHGNMAKIPNGERVLAFKGDSLESLAGLIARGLTSAFDAVYVDASHEMKDVLGDALLSFRLLKVGGIMMFDDYNKAGVERATAAFEEALGDTLKVLYRDETQLVVTKTTEDRFARFDSEVALGDESRLEPLLGSEDLVDKPDLQ
eukprot:g4209.t1